MFIFVFMKNKEKDWLVIAMKQELLQSIYFQYVNVLY